MNSHLSTKNCLLGGSVSFAMLLIYAALVPVNCERSEQNNIYRAAHVKWNYDEMSHKLVVAKESAVASRHAGRALSNVTYRLNAYSYQEL
jgi:hypothetical protein